MGFYIEVRVLLLYLLVLVISAELFSMAATDGVFANVYDSPQGNDTILIGGNFTIVSENSPIMPPICEPVVPNTPLPIIDDIGCLGTTISWINGLRGYTSSNIWFVILLGIPIAVVGLILTVRIFKPGGT